jgi:hypothetical protein
MIKRCSTGSNFDSIADKVFYAIRQDNFLNGNMKDLLTSYAERVGRKMCPLTNPVAIAKAVDMNGFTINQRALMILRRIRQEDGEFIESGQGWIASERKVNKIWREVERQATELVPFDAFFDEEGGIEGIQFDYQKLFDFLMKIYETPLENFTAENPLQVAYTLDGADLTRNTSHLTCG